MMSSSILSDFVNGIRSGANYNVYSTSDLIYTVYFVPSNPGDVVAQIFKDRNYTCLFCGFINIVYIIDSGSISIRGTGFEEMYALNISDINNEAKLFQLSTLHDIGWFSYQFCDDLNVMSGWLMNMNVHEQKLRNAKKKLTEYISSLNDESADSLDSGANYKFVLCTAKVNFIKSIIADIDRALAGTVPDIVLQSTLQAVDEIEENFSAFLGQCGSNTEEQQ